MTAGHVHKDAQGNGKEHFWGKLQDGWRQKEVGRDSTVYESNLHESNLYGRISKDRIHEDWIHGRLLKNHRIQETAYK
jgi:hypothetical protein